MRLLLSSLHLHGWSPPPPQQAHQHRSRLAMAAARLLRLAALDPQHTTTRTRPCSPVRVAKAGLDLAGRAPRLAWTRRDGESRGVRSAWRWWSRGRRESELEQREGGRLVGSFERVRWKTRRSPARCLVWRKIAAVFGAAARALLEKPKFGSLTLSL